MSGDRPFAKMQAIGNDFVVIEEAFWPLSAEWPKLAIRLCDRHFGIGSDGLLVIGPSSVADVKMRMFNPDGTEDMCGNGLRCVVHYAHSCGSAPEAGTIESLDGVHRYRVGEAFITTEMAPPRFDLSEVPVDASQIRAGNSSILSNLDLEIPVLGGTMRVDAVNTGSTHSVILRSTLPDDDEFFRFSPAIEVSPIFPDRTSVLWAIVEDANRIRLRIWERGAGETLGCGTGACAAAVLARLRGLVEDAPVEVASRGGKLRVYWSGHTEAPVELSGSAQVVFRGMVGADA